MLQAGLKTLAGRSLETPALDHDFTNLQATCTVDDCTQSDQRSQLITNKIPLKLANENNITYKRFFTVRNINFFYNDLSR